jgi:hypothetical protein
MCARMECQKRLRVIANVIHVLQEQTLAAPHARQRAHHHRLSTSLLPRATYETDSMTDCARGCRSGCNRCLRRERHAAHVLAQSSSSARFFGAMAAPAATAHQSASAKRAQISSSWRTTSAHPYGKLKWWLHKAHDREFIYQHTHIANGCNRSLTVPLTVRGQAVVTAPFRVALLLYIRSIRN